MAEDDPFRQATSSYFNPCQRLAVIPRHPFRGPGRHFPGVALQFHQVVKGVGAAQLAGVDQTHEQIAHLRPVQRAIEQGVLAMEHCPFQGSLGEVMPTPGLCRVHRLLAEPACF
jgi:hypothetical protein